MILFEGWALAASSPAPLRMIACVPQVSSQVVKAPVCAARTRHDSMTRIYHKPVDSCKKKGGPRNDRTVLSAKIPSLRSSLTSTASDSLPVMRRESGSEDFLPSPKRFSTLSEAEVVCPRPNASIGHRGRGDWQERDAGHAERYEEALRAYQQARSTAARDIVQALLKEQPGDHAAVLLLDRAKRHIGFDGHSVVGFSEAELAAWSGVTIMKDKWNIQDWRNSRLFFRGDEARRSTPIGSFTMIHID